MASSTSQAARRYAEALLASIGDDNAERVAQELESFATAVRESPDLGNVLFNPTFSDEERDQTVSAVMSRMELGEQTQKFIRVLIERDRQSEVESISETFSALVDERLNRAVATIRTAAELNEQTQAQLKAALERRTGKTLDLTIVVDPSLIGGVRAEIGTLVYDGTIKAELAKLSETLRLV